MYMATVLESIEKHSGSLKKIGLFLLLNCLISTIWYTISISTGTAHRVGLFWMWSPGIAAILTKLMYRENLGDFGWQRGKSKYIGLGLGIPFLYATIIYTVAWITGIGGFNPLPIIKIVLYTIVGLVFALVAALGEEIGWRGLLLPELINLMSFKKAALMTGIVWAVWHYPLIIFADYNRPTPLIFQLVVFTIAVIGYSIFTAWLRIKSGSIWPAVIWHGGHNLFIQQIFMYMTIPTGITFYFVDDFGIGILIASIILGMVFLTKPLTPKVRPFIA